MEARIMLAAATLCAALAAPLAAQEKPVQVALFTPVQIVPQNEDVNGVRINFIYSVNRSVKYVDLGLINVATGGESEGVEWALVAYNRGSFQGWQDGVVSITKGAFLGLQSGLYTSAGQGKGLQWGFVNTAQHWNGLQLGVVNYAQSLHGLQIGLINIIKTGGKFPVFPIVNWSF